MIGGMFDEKKSENEIVIFLTGLREIDHPEAMELKGDEFVLAMLDRLISQLSQTAAIRIVSFEKPSTESEDETYKQNVRRLIAASQFNNHINLSFWDDYLCEEDVSQGTFVLNFAGSEMASSWLNNKCFIDASLYIENPREREIIVAKLEVIYNSQLKTNETPFFVYKGHVLDRRECHILTRDNSRLMYHDLAKLKEAKEKLLTAQSDEEKEQARKAMQAARFINLNTSANLNKPSIQPRGR